MARKRTIDTDLLYLESSDLIENLVPLEILIYIRLWGISEDWGGFEWNAKNIKNQMGSVKTTERQVIDFLDKMLGMKKIIRYEKDGKVLGWCKNLLRHQDLNNPSLPRLPLPEWITYKRKQYPSGKCYAEYEIIESKIPVAYQYPTSNTETNRNLKKPKETIGASKDAPFFSPIKDYFISAYKKKYDSLPAIDFGKDGRVVNKARGIFKSVDETYKLIDDFLVSEKAEECGFTLSVCFSSHTINAWKAGKLPKSQSILEEEKRKSAEELARKKREQEIAEKKRQEEEEEKYDTPEEKAKRQVQLEKMRKIIKPIVKKM